MTITKWRHTLSLMRGSMASCPPTTRLLALWIICSTLPSSRVVMASESSPATSTWSCRVTCYDTGRGSQTRSGHISVMAVAAVLVTQRLWRLTCLDSIGQHLPTGQQVPCRTKSQQPSNARTSPAVQTDERCLLHSICNKHTGLCL